MEVIVWMDVFPIENDPNNIISSKKIKGKRFSIPSPFSKEKASLPCLHKKKLQRVDDPNNIRVQRK